MLFTTWNLRSCGAAQLCGVQYGKGLLRTVLIICGVHRRPAQPDSQQEPSAPAVDPVTGKCRPGKVSRTVSTSPLTLDMTVVCSPDPDLLQPGAVAQEVLPADTINKSVTGFDTSTPLVATPAIVVGQQTPQVKDFPTLNLSESSELLPSFGLSPVFLVFLTYAAVGHGRGLVAFVFTQPGV